MHRILITLMLFVAPLLCEAADLKSALDQFAAYEYGQPKKVLHDTRMTAFRGTNDKQQRLKHEQLLLEFVQSSFPVIARREACMWLSDLATEASGPVLEKLAKQDDFADVAQIALDALKQEPAASRGPSCSCGKYKSEVMQSKKPADALTDALLGDNDDTARLAFGLIADGVAAKDASAWLGKSIRKLSESRQIIAMNVLLQLDAKEKADAITAIARKGEGEARLAAVRHLGALGREENMEYLTGLWLGADEPLAKAAAEALRALPADVIEDHMLGFLQSEDIAVQGKAIELVKLRGDAYAANALFEIVGQATNPNQKAAIRAIGKAAPPDALLNVLRGYVSVADTGIGKDMQMAVWDLARRQPDYDQALALMAAQTASLETVSTALSAMAKKLEGMKAKPETTVPAPKPVDARILLPGSYTDIVPKRFGVAAYLNCGPQNKVQQNGITIACPGGKSYNSAPGMDPSLSVLFAGDSLEFTISGLEAGQDYILGLTWWDSTFNGRRQAILINGQEVLPDTPAKAFDEQSSKKEHKAQGRPTPTRIQFALLPEHIQNGKCTVGVKRTGPANTVTSEIWVAKRKQPKAEKQILLVSGQDFPGHHWRKTGPVMEKLICEDERMEVTICESPGAVGLKHLDHYDAVFIHFKNYKEDLAATDVMKKRLMSYVKNGGGMCLSHFACGAFMEWPEFVNISGRIWSGGGHDRRQPFTVKVVDKNHQVTRGLGDSFKTDDELYWCLTGDTKVHLLCEAMSEAKKANQPQAIVLEPGKGRTFLSTLGHDVRAYDAKEVKQLYRQGTAWAAGL